MEIIANYFIYIILGIFAGTMAGLLGIGGGLVIVPALAWIFSYQNLSNTITMHLAIGSSLSIIFFNSVCAVRAHHRFGTVKWLIFWQLTPGIIIGSCLGAVVAGYIPDIILRLFFSFFTLLVSIHTAFDIIPPPSGQTLPKVRQLLVVSTVIGLISILVGIGGGSLIIPFLTWYNIPIRQAVATAAACGLPTALSGAISFIIIGLRDPNLPTWSVGYVYLPALICIVIISTIFVQLGTKLAYSFKTTTLKRILALFLAFTSINILL